MDVSQPRPRQVLPPPTTTPTAPRHHPYSLLHLSSIWVAQVDVHDSYAALRRPSPCPKSGAGSEDIWADTMEVLLMYFLSLFPCTQEEQCVCACVCACVCVCVNKRVFAQQGFEASTHNVAFIYLQEIFNTQTQSTE